MHLDHELYDLLLLSLFQLNALMSEVTQLATVGAFHLGFVFFLASMLTTWALLNIWLLLIIIKSLTLLVVFKTLLHLKIEALYALDLAIQT